MQADSQLIRSERLKRAWSQEQLAHVTGLGLRTVQRIESGGNASLETVKALAAVLELPVEALLAEAPVPSVVLPSPVRFSLFKPWRAFATGCVTTLITLGGFVGIQSAIAEQVRLDFALQIDDAAISQSRMVSEDGSAAVMETADVRVSITPVIQESGMVLLESEVYALRNGEYELVSTPKMLIENTKLAEFRVTNDDGSLVQLRVTATIE